jgi:hypothetical protein
MIRQSLLLSLVFFIGINASLFAQNLLKHIPEDATFVTTLNPSALNAKIPFSKLKEFDFFKMSMEEMAKELDRSNKDEMLKMLNDPASFGMDFMASSYIFGKVTEEGNAFSMMFKLSDAAKFTEFFKSKLPPDVEIVSVDGFNIIAPDQDIAFAWTNDFALITGVEVHRNYDYDYGYEDYPYEEEEMIMEDEEIIMEELDIEEEEIVIEEEEPIFEDQEIIYDEPMIEEDILIEVEEPVIEEDYNYNEERGSSHADKEREFTLNWVKKVMSGDGSASVMKNPKFMLANAKKTDANLWLDYASVYEMYMKEMGGMSSYEMEMLNEFMGVMYDDTYMSIGLNFDPGAVNFNIDSYSNSQMMKFYREATDAKFNKKFHKYVAGEELMGYWSFNINVERFVFANDETNSNVRKYG